MDPDVLKDTNNPTMHNPACTGCHERMDPVAGAFQNYGDAGLYKDQFGGLDSLDDYYKTKGKELGKFGVLGRSSSESERIDVRASLTREDRLHLTLGEGEWGSVALDRLIVSDIEDGSVVHRIEFEDPDSGHSAIGTGCGHAEGDHWRFHCALYVPLGVPVDGVYDIAVVSWHADTSTTTPLLVLSTTPYREGDTWYRDMRKPGLLRDPGFVVELVPDEYNDSSLPWLAERVVEDQRFAEATVKFWWPAIIGSEVTGQPQEGSDIDYEIRKLAADAQADEVRHLAGGFRRGWSDRGPYNLKDLLVEIVMSYWFRAESLDDDDPVRRAALRSGQAGARRLLAPEELARKTAVVTGFQWGRIRGQKKLRDRRERTLSNLSDADWGYRMLYGRHRLRWRRGSRHVI